MAKILNIFLAVATTVLSAQLAIASIFNADSSASDAGRETSNLLEGAASDLDWKSYNNSLDGQRYSPLTYINKKNVSDMVEICRAAIADTGSFQAGLIVIGHTMFATTANETIALDPVGCTVKWRTAHQTPQEASLPNRGVAYANGRIFRGTGDAQLIAMDAQTGQILWTDIVGDPRLGEWISAAPLAWNGLIYVGTAGGDFGIRGRIMAFDAITGREVWRFHTIPMGKEFGARTWKNTAWAAHGGGATWSSFSLDATTEELFVPVGNAAPAFSPADRSGRNLFSNSVLVLNALDGSLKWWYQLTNVDMADHDLSAAPVLYSDQRGGARLAAAGKDGYLHIVDRRAHALIRKTAVTTISTAPDSAERHSVKVCPGIAGGVEWNGPAFDPTLHTLFVGAVDYCGVIHSKPNPNFIPGTITFNGSWSPSLDPATGWITAVDAENGSIRWKYHAEAPVVSGVTATAAGILMAGDNLGNFLIFDSASGALLQKMPTGGSLSGGVITYEQDGKQYVAITSGNVSKTVFGASGRPSIIIMTVATLTSAAEGGGTSETVRGSHLFLQKCSSCHGPDGKSISINGTDLTTIHSRMNIEQLTSWIKNPSPPMPKIFVEPLDKSQERDIHDIAVFLLAWRP